MATKVAIVEEKKSDEGPQIPIIDIKGLDSNDEAVRKRCVKQMHDAAVNWGVMHIVGHGIPAKLDKLREVGTQFFDLLVKEKEKYAKDQPSGMIQGCGSKLANSASEMVCHLMFPENQTDLSIWPRKPSNYVYVIVDLLYIHLPQAHVRACIDAKSIIHVRACIFIIH